MARNAGRSGRQDFKCLRRIHLLGNLVFDRRNRVTDVFLKSSSTLSEKHEAADRQKLPVAVLFVKFAVFVDVATHYSEMSCEPWWILVFRKPVWSPTSIRTGNDDSLVKM